MSKEDNKYIFIINLLLLVGASQYSFFEESLSWAFISTLLSLVSLSVFFKYQKKLKVWSRNPFYKGQPVELFLWSNKIRSDEEDDREELLIENLNLKIKGARLFMSVLSIGLGVLFLFQFGINISLYGFILFVFNILFLVLSSYIGHLLVLGLVNSALAFIFVDQTNYPILLLEIGLFCSFVTSFVALKKNQKYSFKRVVKFFGILSILVLGFSFILPSELSLISYKGKKDKYRSQSYSQNRVGGLSISLPKPPKVKLTSNQLAVFNKMLDDHENDLNSFSESMSRIPNFSNSELEKINQLKIELKETRGELASVSLEEGLSEEDLLKTFQRIENISRQKSKIAERVKGRIEDTQKGYDLFPNKAQEDLLKSFKEENLKEKAEEFIKVDVNQDYKEVKENIETALASEKQIFEEKTEIIKDQIAREEIEKERDEKIFESLKWLQKGIRIIVVFVFVTFILFLFKRKKKVIDILDKDIKDSMKKSLRAIAKEHLTPNQEIIKSYNIFKKMIKAEVFPDSEVPPPVTLCKLIAEESQPEATWSVTDLFCHCYYGDYKASENDRNQFRKAFKLLLK